MTKMNAKTLKALKGSIAKWEGIVAGTVEDLGPSNCPLCKMFFLNDDCVGCPVSENTGEGGCSNTPYDKWYETEDIKYAKEEVEYLKSLLPEKE